MRCGELVRREGRRRWIRRLEEPDLPEFDPSVWPEEVQKLVLEEVEK